MHNEKIYKGTVIATTRNGTCSNNCNKTNQTTRFAEIRAALGWNFCEGEDYHVGLGILAAAPTGTRVTNVQLFQPMIGNGHHWELGARFTSHYTFWRSCDYTQSFGLHVDADITHLFATQQCRTFGLCGKGDNSYYMLAEVMSNDITNNLSGNPIEVAPVTGFTQATAQFANTFTPVANITSARVSVSQDAQCDLTAMFSYNHCGFTWDVGYNLWATSCEKIRFCNNDLLSNNKTYALKGDALVYGFDTVNAYAPIALSATQSSATIHSGTNQLIGPVNNGIDNYQFAFGDATGGAAHNALSATPGMVNAIGTSIQSVFLTSADLDVAGNGSKGLSNKVFTHINYTWEDHECYLPYLGVGGKAEWATTTNSCDKKKCMNSNISEWGVWLKGGFSFN